MRARRWLLLAATAVPFLGAGMVAAAFDRTQAGSDVVAEAGGTTDRAHEAAPVRVVNFSGDATAADAPKDRTSRLPMDGEVRVVRSGLDGGMAVIVRETGDAGEILMSVDPARRTTEIAQRADLPRVSLDPAEGGGFAVSAAVDRDRARDIVLEAIASRADMAHAIFFRTDLGVVEE